LVNNAADIPEFLKPIGLVNIFAWNIPKLSPSFMKLAFRSTTDENGELGRELNQHEHDPHQPLKRRRISTFIQAI